MIPAKKCLSLIAVAATLAAWPTGGGATTPLRIHTVLDGRGVSAVFVGSLSGSALSWQVAFRGSPTATLRIRLHESAFTLCRACRSGRSGRIDLARSAIHAIAAGAASLELTPPQAARPPVTAPITRGLPTLEITSLHDDQTVTLPASVTYRISSFPVGPAPLGHLQLTAPGIAPIEIPLTAPAGTFTIPDTKSQFLPGRRDLAFALVTAADVAPPNPEANVTIHDVTIIGRR